MCCTCPTAFSVLISVLELLQDHGSQSFYHSLPAKFAWPKHGKSSVAKLSMNGKLLEAKQNMSLAGVTSLPLAKQRKAVLGKSLETPLAMVGTVVEHHAITKHVLDMEAKHFGQCNFWHIYVSFLS